MGGLVEKPSLILRAPWRSIATVLITALVAVVTLLLGLFATALYTTERDQRRAELHRTMDLSLSQATAGLALPMWGLDDKQITSIMQAGMSQREVYAISVTMPGRTYRLARDANWQVAAVNADPPATATDLLRKEGIVRHADEPLGTVQVFVSPRFMEADLRERRHAIVGFILALDVALVLSMGLLLWVLALKPIRALQRYAGAVKDGLTPPSSTAGTWFYGELKALNQSIGEMTDMLDARYLALQGSEEHIRQLNADLELRVKERTAQLEAAAAELARARDEAEAATRTKSDFLANMSHEIRTPMNAVIGLTGLALRTELSARQRGYLTNVIAAADSLLGIINDILDFSKIEAGKLDMESRDFKVSDVLEKLTSVVALKAHEKGVDFLIDIDSDVPQRLVGDALRLGQVLVNLCANAVKFTERGEVCLRIRREAVLPDGRVSLRFAVNDTGIGMGQSQLAKLFKPFSQVDASTTRVFGGTGLGLAISQQIVSMMGGDIAVRSEPGHGSEFHFTVAFEVAEADAQPSAPDPRLAGLRVLVIDDSAQSRAIMGALLQRLGCVPTLTDSVAAGMTALERAADEHAFDLIMVDGKMPDLDGAELVALVGQWTGRAQKMIVLTSFCDDEAARLILQSGMGGCLRRPASIQALGETIVNLLDPHVPEHGGGSGPQATADVPQAVLRGRRVLLAEDNAINQMIAAELLGKVAGMEVTIAEDGEQALKCLRTGVFDAVLMDIQMPVLDGLQATTLIREDPAYQALPIIAMTAHAMASDKEKCLAAGMSDCVIKPFEPDQLFSVLARWIQPLAPVGVDFELALKHCAGRVELLERIGRRFLTSRRFDAEYIRAALERGDTEEAANIAHQLISTAGTLGAMGLSAAARDLQISIMAGEARCWPAQLETIDRQLAAVVSELHMRFDGNAVEPSVSGARVDAGRH